ncbi:hypothetical protein R1sor_022778 [Riccia sorocarpa]|uniref:Uncharacterized protein n=1 Tax=Riccia sorocarpa TaxID=122646 RepID=A0ABD3GNU6_9MARC
MVGCRDPSMFEFLASLKKTQGLNEQRIRKWDGEATDDHDRAYAKKRIEAFVLVQDYEDMLEEKFANVESENVSFRRRLTR